MGCGRGLLSLFFNNTRPKKLESSPSLSGNDSKILEELITSSNCKCNVPARVFSAKELIKATNHFSCHNMVIEDAFYSVNKGSFENQSILVKKYRKEDCFWPSDKIKSYAIRDIKITSQMCSHEHVLKFIGCCLELQFSALVYEYKGKIQFLSHGLHERVPGSVHNGSLSWKSRLSIANDIASALVYLHTTFSTPIVHRNLKPSNFIIDQGGVAKLLDFSLSISIPQGESQVEDMVVGTCGFTEPKYMATGILTSKTDVYSFGAILLEILTGQMFVDVNRGKNHDLLGNFVIDNVNKGKLNKVVDPRTMVEEGGIEQEKQFGAFVAIALKCTEEKREDRPEMINVAEELKRIQRFVDTDH
ncbi:Non-functional pseudokinase ZED1 [Camellia lanceoleosa]|uniref:Non-functional pseudokinase ZED1 n=1 Tax=Camellia lanceoleosa TaxID=1840588 RepID=A0ACC0FS57_9ERIC|nr:Non-functional pseudokinase ZED1 [Camellia lanceoleosa]